MNRDQLDDAAALIAAARGLYGRDSVAREVLERFANPALWDFLTLAREQDDRWAEALLRDLVATSGTGSPEVWQVRVDEVEAPAVARMLRIADGPDEVHLRQIFRQERPARWTVSDSPYITPGDD